MSVPAGSPLAPVALFGDASILNTADRAWPPATGGVMKLFAGLNVWALPLAAVLSFVFGGIWYGLLSKQWMAAVGRTEEELRGAGGPPVAPFAITFVAQLVMAWMLAGLILHMRLAGIPPGLRTGMLIGAIVWFGFVLMPLIVNHVFQMQRPSLTVIDGLHWLGVLLIQGAVLGFWGLV
jgi:hypothetical protein